MPFAEDDAAFFFGREQERELVIANLMAARFTVVYGSSGVGKSSLLRAGVKHRLREVARENLRSSGTPQLGVVVFGAWRDDPTPLLQQSITRAVAEAWQVSETRELENAVDRPLDEALQRAAESVDGEIIVMLDQFEEYFLYHAAEDDASRFVVELPRAIANEGVRASFLVSIREDALAKLDYFEDRIPNLFGNLLRVDHLDRDAARRAIEEPIAMYNRRVSPSVSIEPALVETVLDEVRIGRVTLGGPHQVALAQPEHERIETPYLQLVMQRLWEDATRDGELSLRLATLQGLGGAEQIVHTHLDATMDELSPRERDIAARIFSFLVTPSGTKIAHSGADLAAYAGAPRSEVEPLLARLSAARILMPVAPNSERATAGYEIFHDVLAAAIVDWRSRYLHDRERDVAGRQLAVEQRRVRHLRGRVVSLSGLLLVVVILAIIALLETAAVGNAQQVALSREASQRLESLFVACFAFGGLFTVASALMGVHGHAGAHHTGRLPGVSLSSLLAFLTWFGAAGFVLERYTEWGLAAVLLGATAAGVAGWYLITRFLDLVLSGESELNPDDYRMEGTVGRVSIAIPAGGTGEVVFTMGGVRRSEAARALAGPVPRGTEVMITRYANGFATVQPHSRE
jgi:membrane protein implicated in regulation of membrane protease activity